MAVRIINDNQLTAIADAIRTQLDATVGMKPGDMPGLIGDIGVGYVPDYWKSYLATKATEINATLDAAGENRSAFLWYTDAHWTTNYGQSPMILKYLSKNTGMQKTFFGGDIANAKSGEDATLRAWQGMVIGVPNHHSVLGNHDNQITALATPGERGDFFLTPERSGDVVLGTDATYGKTHYYIDNHIEKTRYICLNTGNMWTYNADTAFCVDALSSTPKGWHIVVVSHIWLLYNDDQSVNPTPPDYTQHLLDLFDEYNYRKSGTTSENSVAYNFENAGGKVEFIIGGHIHRDYDFTTAKGIPVILTECDSTQDKDGASDAVQGTTTENCVYAVVADYSAKQVKVINVGRGSTRSLAIPDVVTYTNWAQKAIGTDGAIYNNGKGYKENTRLNSAGAETTQSGWYVTGFIPAKPGDVIRLKNCYFPKTFTSETNRSAVHPYDASFAFKNNYASASGLPDLTNAYDTDGVNIIQITIPNWMGSTYIRLTVRTLSADSIITVNEEIG